MNKTELIGAVSLSTRLSRQEAEAAIDALVYEITAGVKSGEPVRITGFGTFKLRERPARKGRNPQTGEAVKVKASKGIGFTPGVRLKADLNSRGAVPKPKPLPGIIARASVAAPVAKRATAVVKKAAPVAKKAAPVAKRTTAVAKKAAPVAKKAAAVAKKAAPVAKKAAPAAKRTATKASGVKKAGARRR